MLSIDLKGKRALVAGVADDGGFRFRDRQGAGRSRGERVRGHLATGTRNLRDAPATRQDGRFAQLRIPPGKLEFERVYPLDAEYDTMEQMSPELRDNKRYRELGDVSVGGLAQRLKSDFGESCLDIVVHSLANGPEVKKPLLETSRSGYLSASSASAYSFVSLVQHLGPLDAPGGLLLGPELRGGRAVIPGYGGGMSSAKAALESDTRVLAYEAGRKWGHRVNVISAGPYASRAASAIGFIGAMIDYCRQHTPLPEPLKAREVATAAAFLASDLAAGITGHTALRGQGLRCHGLAH